MEKIDFIGVGAYRSGTTWLSKYLADHPDILFSSQKSVKELYFFNDSYPRKYEPYLDSHFNHGISWYLDQFPNTEKDKVRGEFCPAYLVDNAAPQRIKQFFPDIKVLISLRNPVDRLYSLFWHYNAAVVADMSDDFQTLAEDKEYLDKKKYSHYLKKYYRLFPKENIHIILFDEIKQKPKSTIQKLYKFLEVDPNHSPQILNEKINPSQKTRFNWLKNVGYQTYNLMRRLKLEKIIRLIYFNKQLFKIYRKINCVKSEKKPMNKKLRIKLINFYRQDIEKTSKLINKDLTMWLK